MLLSMERRDNEPKRRDVASVYCLEASHFFPTLTHSSAGILTHTRRSPLLRPPTTLPPLPPPVFPHSNQSSVPVSHIPHHAVVHSPLFISAPREFNFCVARPRLVPVVGLFRPCEPIRCPSGCVSLPIAS